MDIDRTANTTVQDTIDDDYKKAFRAGDKKLYIALRPVLSTIKQATIDRRHELSNEEILDILRTEVKKRRDVLEQFKQGGRQDLVEQTEFELETINKYLPAQMGDEDLEKIVRETLAEVGATGPQDMGKTMGAVMAKVKGQADGTRVKEMVEKLLA